MSRYIIKQDAPRAVYWESWDYIPPTPPIQQPQLWATDPVDTGLLDANGKKVLRLPDQIGFLRGIKA